MSKKRVYFGTKEKMSWVKAPSINMVRGVEKFGSSGTYTNGGGYVLGSAGSHENYDLSWSLTDSEDIDLVQMYYSGIYGSGLIYWSDPFVSHRNALPLGWSAPGLGAADAPTLFVGRKPTLVKTAANSIGLPVDTAVYVGSIGMQHREIWVPVPEGHSVAIGVIGSATGNGSVQYKKDNGTWVALPFLAASTTTTVNSFLEGLGGGVSLRVQITTGTISLAALTVKVYKVEGISGGVTTNLATNPSFETTSGTVEVWRNLVLNPSFENSTTGWGGSGATLERTTSIHHGSGIASAQVTPNSTSTHSGDIRGGNLTTFPWGTEPGKTYTFSAWVYTPEVYTTFNTAYTSRQKRILLFYSLNGTTPVEAFGPQGTNTVGWQRISHTFTIPEDASGVILGVGCAGSPTDPNFRTYVDEVLLMEGGVGVPYFDGNTSPDPDLTPSWTGAVNNSESVLTGLMPSNVVQPYTGQGITYLTSDSPVAGVKALRCLILYQDVVGVPIVGFVPTQGTTYTVLARLRASRPLQVSMRISGTRGETFTLGEEWTPVVFTAVAGAPNAYGTGPYLAEYAGHRFGDYVDVDTVLITEGEYTGPYFDGNTISTDTSIFFWNGTPDASTSTMRRLGNNSGANKFILGGGTSGMKFVPNTFNRVGYSAVVGKGLESAGVQLKEVGSWLN